MKFSMKAADVILICLYIVGFLISNLRAAPLDIQDDKIQPKHSTLIPQSVNLLKYENANIGIDGYDFAFETSDGVSRQEKATVKNLGTDQEAISVEGTVSWVGPDGIQYTLNYLADENGFQPEGKHLPVAPET